MALYNWAAAFVAFCNNHPCSEISEKFGIPLEMLENKAARERWAALRNELPLTPLGPIALQGPVESLSLTDPFSKKPEGLQTPTEAHPNLPVALRAGFIQLAENRKKNFKQADRLRTRLDAILTKLEKNELKITQVFHNKGEVVTFDRDLNPSDLVNLATYARLVQEMTYRALGDFSAHDGKGTDSPVGGQPQPQIPGITIVLPGAIAQPRFQQALEKEAEKKGQTIDIQTVIDGKTNSPTS